MHSYRYDLLKKIISAFMMLMVVWTPYAFASTQFNQHQMSNAVRENRNTAQLKQTIREMHFQRMKEKKIERQFEKKIERHSQAEEIKEEKKDRFSKKMNSLSPEERQALRKQIKEARMQIYEKNEKHEN